MTRVVNVVLRDAKLTRCINASTEADVAAAFNLISKFG